MKKIISVAAWAGILAGLLLTAVQQVQVVPIILKAEIYEEAADSVTQSNHTHASVEREHERHADAWQPANGWQRNLFTTGANLIVGLGFALLLVAAITLRGKAIDWRTGLLWGAAAYAVFFVAPSLGLPPEVPGTEAASLTSRQSWWVVTATLTAAGLALLTFCRHRAVKFLGMILLVLPHLVGAPQPQVHSSAAPEDLAHAFIVATAIANAVFWLGLGGLTGFFFKRIA